MGIDELLSIKCKRRKYNIPSSNTTVIFKKDSLNTSIKI